MQGCRIGSCQSTRISGDKAGDEGQCLHFETGGLNLNVEIVIMLVDEIELVMLLLSPDDEEALLHK